MKRPDVIAFVYLLLDMFGPLCVLSLTLQSDQTTLANVAEKIEVAKDAIISFMIIRYLCFEIKGQITLYFAVMVQD